MSHLASHSARRTLASGLSTREVILLLVMKYHMQSTGPVAHCNKMLGLDQCVSGDFWLACVMQHMIFYSF